MVTHDRPRSIAVASHWPDELSTRNDDDHDLNPVYPWFIHMISIMICVWSVYDLCMIDYQSRFIHYTIWIHDEYWLVTGITARYIRHSVTDHSVGSVLLQPSPGRLRDGEINGSGPVEKYNENRNQKISRQSIKQNVSRILYLWWLFLEKRQSSDSGGSRGTLQETPEKLGFCCHSKQAKLSLEL